MIVGFSGTRQGMTPEQRSRVAELLRLIEPEAVVHGDCVGADAEFDRIAEDCGIQRRCRPCSIAVMRAFTGAEQIDEPRPPLERNRLIVQDASVLIACPAGRTEEWRGSGTWSTVRAAGRAGKPAWLVFPDGSVERRGEKSMSRDGG